MTTPSKALLEIHIATLLFGVSGLFGKLLALDPGQIVLGRTLVGALLLAGWLYWKGSLKSVFASDQWLVNLLLGGLLCLHWMTFFHSIQVSTVTIGLLAFASFPVFVTFLEPLLFREPLRLFDVGMAAIVVLGLYIVLPSGDEGSEAVYSGIAWGLFSAFLFAVLSLVNRARVQKTESLSLSFLQNTGAALVAFPFVLMGSGLEPMVAEIPLLVVLGVLCTTLPVMLFLNSLTVIKAQLASLVICLEPVYGIVFAVLLLGEAPGLNVLLGGAVMLGGITAASVYRSH